MQRGWEVTHLLSIVPEDRDSMLFHTPNLHLTPLQAGFDIAFSSVSAEGLDASWLGRRWDDRVIRDLLRLQETRGVHPCGEGGEFETLVLDAPPFEQALEIVRATPDWRGTAGVWRVEEARLVPKWNEELNDADRVEST